MKAQGVVERWGRSRRSCPSRRGVCKQDFPGKSFLPQPALPRCDHSAPSYPSHPTLPHSCTTHPPTHLDEGGPAVRLHLAQVGLRKARVGEAGNAPGGQLGAGEEAHVAQVPRAKAWGGGWRQRGPTVRLHAHGSTSDGWMMLHQPLWGGCSCSLPFPTPAALQGSPPSPLGS